MLNEIRLLDIALRYANGFLLLAACLILISLSIRPRIVTPKTLIISWMVGYFLVLMVYTIRMVLWL